MDADTTLIPYGFSIPTPIAETPDPEVALAESQRPERRAAERDKVYFTVYWMLILYPSK